MITPSGQAVPVPTAGNTDLYQSASLDLELSRRRYAWSRSLQVQISLSFKGAFIADRLLTGWQLRLACRRAQIGRVDGWMNNSGFAAFAPHPMVESARTVGLPATGDDCLAVASYVSRADWASDEGPQEDRRVVAGRASPSAAGVRRATAAGSRIWRRRDSTSRRRSPTARTSRPGRSAPESPTACSASRAPAWQHPWSPGRWR